MILKELQPKQAKLAEARERFLREACITGQLEHPSIVPVYEIGERQDDSCPFYTMRFIRGRTLAHAISEYHRGSDQGREPGLELRRLLGALISVCNAIAYAHSRAVIHRDLKPENIVLGAFGEVVLLDWGLAKLVDQRDTTEVVTDPIAGLDPHATAAGSVLGTPAYMAPEQAAGESARVDSRTDIYGIGATLFEVLTGQPPHVGKKVKEVIDRILAAETPRARALVPGVPPPLDAMCAKAMARAPEDRYWSASDLADDIQRWLADEPVSAYREPAGEQAVRWMRRNRNSTVVAVMVLVAGSLFGFSSWWQRSNALQQELKLLGMETQHGGGRLSAHIEILRDDVRYLASQGSIEPILKDSGSGSDEDKAKHKDDLAQVFQEFLLHRPNYFQARLLDKSGMEIVRVDRDPALSASGVAAEPRRVLKLQPKDKSPYFTKPLRLEPGEVYISELELNKEEGIVDKRRIPVIRASVPVHVPDHPDDTGVVVINIDFRPHFDMLRRSFRPAGMFSGDEPDGPGAIATRFVYVTDQEGVFLWNPENQAATFGSFRIQSVYPGLQELFDDPDTGGGKISGGESRRRAVYLYKLGFDPRDEKRFLGLVVAAPYEEILARARGASALSFYLGLSLLILLPALAMLFFRRSTPFMRGQAVSRSSSSFLSKMKS